MLKKPNQTPNYEHDQDMTPKCPNFVIRLWELMEFFHWNIIPMDTWKVCWSLLNYALH